MQKETENYNSASGDTSKNRAITKYDSKNRLIKHYGEYLKDGEWKFVSGSENSYTDSAGFTTQIVESFIIDSASVLILRNLRKTTFDYDSKGNLLLKERFLWREIALNSFVWELEDGQTYTYGNDNKYKEEIYYMNQGNRHKDSNIIWSNWEKKQMASYDHYIWKDDSARWIISSKVEIVYPDDNTVVETFSFKRNNVWTKSHRRTVVRLNGKIEEEINENYMNSAWVMTGHNKNDYVYDNNKLILKIYKELKDYQALAYDSLEKWVYEDFVEVTGINNKSIFPEINIYPNPVLNILNVTIYTDKTSTSEIKFYDLNGKIISTQMYVLKNGSNKIPINMNHIKPGIYLLKIQNSDGRFHTWKIVKAE